MEVKGCNTSKLCSELKLVTDSLPLYAEANWEATESYSMFDNPVNEETSITVTLMLMYSLPFKVRGTVRGLVRASNARYLTVLNRTWLRLQKTEHKQRGTSCVYTARRNRLPCTSNVLWTVKFWKLLNQNLTIQATESDERYPRLTVFNVFEGQTERFVANVVQFLRNSPLSGKLYTLHDFSPL